MCGICGNFNLTKDRPVDVDTLKRMVLLLKHRGPEGFGIFTDNRVGLGHARLQIIDLEGGHQPIHNEDKTVWITFNGEIYNYLELRDELIKKGHHFYTRTDTEVIVHLYEERGAEFLQSLNGEFSLAIWNAKKRELLLARDRVGIKPLFYTVFDGSLLFASEIKSLFAENRVMREIDVRGLDDLFTFWATLPPRTVFKNIFELPPAHYMVAADGKFSIQRYWDLSFPALEQSKREYKEDDYAQRLFDLIMDSIKLRLRADVPVASYLSGGLDSSFISALVKKFYNSDLQTFSVSFADKYYDESAFQRHMAETIGTTHKVIHCSYEDVGRIMPDVVWHAEKPLIRTAPAPLFLLSRLVRESGIKVVLTGEGADEILAGYDLFKEMKIRRFWSKYPDSKLRPELFRKLYQSTPNWPRKASAFLESFYRSGLNETDKKCYSHIPRWNTTSWVKSAFSKNVKEELNAHNNLDEFERQLPETFSDWDDLAKAQYIEINTLLAGNLLSSQGDRMLMANSVEGRVPYLDHRLVEFCATIPATLKLKALVEKYILKKIAVPFLPPEITKRTKQAYRAPDSASFFGGQHLDYVSDLLSERDIAQSGYFDPATVTNLVKKCRNAGSNQVGAKYDMAIVGIITTLLLDKLFLRDFTAKVNTISADNLNIKMYPDDVTKEN